MAPAAFRLLSALLLYAALAGAASAADDLLYVWTGDDDHQQPDFLTVLEFDPTSPNYGKVVSKVDLTGPSAYGNEVRGPKTESFIAVMLWCFDAVML